MTNPKGAQGINRIGRLLDLVPYISAHQGISLTDLANAFSSTPAHITEDLNTLWMCGLPGYTPLELMELSFESGFVTIQNAQTLKRPRSLGRDEILALILGLEYLKDQVSSENVLKEIADLLAKLSNLVGNFIHERLTTAMPALAGIRSQLSLAVDHREALTIEYHSLVRDSVTFRTILPLDIFTENNTEYLLAFCNLSHSHRTFRLDRILSITQNSNESTIPEGTPNQNQGKTTINLSIISRERDVREAFGLEVKVHDSQRDLETSVDVFNTDWAVRIVMSMGGAVAIDAPTQTSRAVSERAAKALLGYEVGTA